MVVMRRPITRNSSTAGCHGIYFMGFTLHVIVQRIPIFSNDEFVLSSCYCFLVANKQMGIVGVVLPWN